MSHIDMPRVAVVLSTYNGSAYLREQLDSIYSQGHSRIQVFVRDDSSSDGTLAILDQYKRERGLEYVVGENVGPTRSFFLALQAVGNEFDYYALCDQDDVWHSNKVAVAVRALSEVDTDELALFCSELQLCDQSLTPIEKSMLKRSEIRPELLLFDNMCSGNTMVMTRGLREFVLAHDYDGAYYHDWWVAMIAVFFGRLFYCPEALVDYRRTGSNVSSNGKQGMALLLERLRTFLMSGHLANIRKQLESFYKAFADLLSLEQKRLFITALSNSRIKRAFAPFRYRQSIADELQLRFLMLLNLI